MARQHTTWFLMLKALTNESARVCSSCTGLNIRDTAHSWSLMQAECCNGSQKRAGKDEMRKPERQAAKEYKGGQRDQAEGCKTHHSAAMLRLEEQALSDARHSE